MFGINLDTTYRETLKDIEDNLYFDDFSDPPKKIFVEENGLEYLLTFFPESFYHIPGKSNSGRDGIMIAINCNDIFWWAFADCEPFTYGDIEALYHASKEKWGIIKWVCLKRGMRPQHPVEDMIKKDGEWDDKMEALPVREFTG